MDATVQIDPLARAWRMELWDRAVKLREERFWEQWDREQERRNHLRDDWREQRDEVLAYSI